VLIGSDEIFLTFDWLVILAAVYDVVIRPISKFKCTAQARCGMNVIICAIILLFERFEAIS
jgi:hypothetical protein